MQSRIDNQHCPAVLTIAGFDPSGHAGIIADVRTIEAFHCRSFAVITSLTFQNSQRVFGAIHQNADSLRAQMAGLLEADSIAAVKVGMLPTREIVLEVARLFTEASLPLPVIDPVLRSTSGYDLIEESAIEPLVNELLPRARVITPNVPEAERLTGLRIEDEEGMREAARRLREFGARAVLVKGGHLPGKQQAVRGQKSEGKRQAIDILDDEGQVSVFRGEWIDAPNVRGTGCMLSAAIAAGLARAKSLDESVRLAKEYVACAIADPLHNGTPRYRA